MTQGKRGGRRKRDAALPPPRRNVEDPRPRVHAGTNSRYGMLERTGPCRYERDVSLPREALLDVRRRDACDLKLQGRSLRQIGLRLHADPSVNSHGEHYPGGYGWRNHYQGKPPISEKSLLRTVARDITTMLRNSRIANETLRQEALQLKLEALETAAAAIWGNVLGGNARAQEVWLANFDRQIDLMGLTSNDLSPAMATEGDPQPDWDRAFVTGMLETLQSIDAKLGHTSNDALRAANDRELEAKADIIDVEVLDADIVET